MWEDGPDGPQVIHCAVPLSAEGVSIELTWDTTGMRASGSHTVQIEDVFVPDAAVSLIRPAGVWAPIWNIVVGVALPLIMSVYVGAADTAVDVVKSRLAGTTDVLALSQVGEMLNSHQTAMDLVAAMYAETSNLEFALSDAMSARILSRKSVVAEAVVDTVRRAVAVVGGIGFSRGFTIERLLRDVQASQCHPLPLTRQVQLTGRVAMGLPPVA